MAKRPVLVALVLIALLAVAAAGMGKRALEARSADSVRITPADESAAAIKGADPTPKAGTLVLGKQPLDKARAQLAAMTASDKVVVTIASFGRSGDETNLNMTVENRGACTVVALSGVAYGFDAYQRPAQVNAGGEPYIAFAFDKQSIKPGESAQVSAPTHHVPRASLGAAHIDATSCEDGTRWTRP